MSRTSAQLVRGVVEVDPQIDLERFITTANALVDTVAANDNQSLLNTALLTEIETYLAAHFYALRDPQYVSRSTDGASATFEVGQQGQGFKSTRFGQTALQLDLTGTLTSMGGPKLSMVWLGKTESEALDYSDRN